MAWALLQLGYRRTVVWDNLRRCFPEKSETALREIARESYRNLADVTLESLKSMTMPLAEINRRFAFKQTEAVKQCLDAGQMVMLAGGHYGNWEWAAMTLGRPLHGSVVGIYKPLSNKYLDAFLLRHRQRGERLEPLPMKETLSAMRRRKGQPTALMLIADQSPSNSRTAHWVQFLGQDTACLPGVDAVSRTMGMPVFYFSIQRARRGFYEMTYTEICLDPTLLAPGEITQKFMSALEKDIRQKPENWLWSHRRWKMHREN